MQSPPTGIAELKVLRGIMGNVSRIVKSLPNSPVRTAFLHEITRGVQGNKAADLLGLHKSSISRASEYHDRPFVEFLRQLGFPRTNRAESHQFLVEWLTNDANCPVPSGWNRRCFTGSASLMWAEYAAASLSRSIAPLQPETFHAVRKRKRVGIREGDIFINRDEVELEELRRQLEEDPSLDFDDKIADLERNLKFCKERKKHYRDCHQQLRGNPKKMLVTIDFTATQTGMQDKFCNFVVVVCTDSALYVPLSLVNEIAEPEQPPSKKKAVEKPVIEKKRRRSKKEITESGNGGRNLLPSWNQERAKLTQKEQPELADNDSVYKPFCSVFHFVIKRGDDSPGQTSPYVQWAMNYLFVKHELGAYYDELHVFSDGCGKHFKTYPTHWYALQFSLYNSYYLTHVGTLPTSSNIFATTAIRRIIIITTATIEITPALMNYRRLCGIFFLLVMRIIDAMLLLPIGRGHRRVLCAILLFSLQLVT